MNVFKETATFHHFFHRLRSLDEKYKLKMGSVFDTNGYFMNYPKHKQTVIVKNKSRFLCITRKAWTIASNL